MQCIIIKGELMKAPKFDRDYWINKIITNTYLDYCLAGCQEHNNKCPMCVASHGYRLKEGKR